MVKKIGAVFITVLLFCCMSVPAMAATTEFESPASLYWITFVKLEDGTSRYIEDRDSVSLPRYNVQSSGIECVIGSYGHDIEYAWTDLQEFKVNANGTSYFYGNLTFYLSFYFATDNAAVTWQNVLEDEGLDNYFVDVYDSRGTELRVVQKATYFEADSSPYASNSPGFTMKYQVEVPQETPYISLDFNRASYTFVRAFGLSEGDSIRMVIPSATLLIERSSEETEAIEEVANIIIEQNNISNQYYSNVIQKVDQIYSEVNNIQELQQEVINRMDEFNDVTSIPGSVTTKTEQAAQLITGLEGLEKPDPEQIVPDLTVDTTDISQVMGAFFQNALIMQVLLMSLGFCLVSYVLYGKK